VPFIAIIAALSILVTLVTAVATGVMVAKTSAPIIAFGVAVYLLLEGAIAPVGAFVMRGHDMADLASACYVVGLHVIQLADVLNASVPYVQFNHGSNSSLMWTWWWGLAVLLCVPANIVLGRLHEISRKTR
jgi:hypothetical protein